MNNTLFTYILLMTPPTDCTITEAQKLFKLSRSATRRTMKKPKKSYASQNKNPGRANRHIYTNKDMKM
jgi:hypothetical protein